MVTIHIFWTMVEVGVALVAICLPLFRPGTLLRKNHWIQRWLGAFDAKPSKPPRQANNPYGRLAPAADQSEHKRLVSIGVVEKSSDKLASANHDYHVAVESMQDVALANREFRDRYDRFFPATETTLEVSATHMV